MSSAAAHNNSPPSSLRGATPTRSPRDRLTNACAEFVIRDLQPLNVVESHGLKHLLEDVASNGGCEIIMPSPCTLKKRLADMKKSAVETIRRALKDKQPALTCSVWTSDDRTRYLNISCRYIEERDDMACKLVSCLLSCEELPGFRPNSTTIAGRLKQTMKNFGIENTVISVTTASDVDMKAAVTDHMPAQIWQACAAHMIELAIKPVTEEGSITQTSAFHNKVVTHVKSPPENCGKIGSSIEEARGEISKALPLSCATRWGSAFIQAKAILNHETQIKIVLDFDKDHNRGGLSLAYPKRLWTRTKRYSEMLEPFAAVVKVLQQGDEFLTNGMMPVLLSILRPVIRARATDPGLQPKKLKVAAKEMFDNLEGLFDEPSAAQKIAAYLDVRCKQLQWSEICEAASYRSTTTATAMRVCETDAQLAEEKGQVLPLVTAEVGAVGGRKGKTVKAATAFASILKRQAAAAAAAEAQLKSPVITASTLERNKSAAKDELRRYETEEPLPGDASPQAVLDWWFAHKNTFPTLYRVACVYLAIPATSPATKRAFATSEDTIILKRNNLGAEEVDALVFLRGCEGVGWKATRGE